MQTNSFPTRVSEDLKWEHFQILLYKEDKVGSNGNVNLFPTAVRFLIRTLKMQASYVAKPHSHVPLSIFHRREATSLGDQYTISFEVMTKDWSSYCHRHTLSSVHTAIVTHCHHRRRLTEVLQGLFNLLGREVNVGIWRNEGCVEPVVVVITVDGVGS